MAIESPSPLSSQQSAISDQQSAVDDQQSAVGGRRSSWLGLLALIVGLGIALLGLVAGGVYIALSLSGRRMADPLSATTIGLLPLFTMCDRWDIGGLSMAVHPDTGQPEIFIYDGYPGGVGIAEQGFLLLTELWQAVLDTIGGCPCDDGCPSCIQSPKCGNNNHPLDKRAALWLLKSLLR